MADSRSWPGGRRPVAGFTEKLVLGVREIAEIAEIQALFLKRIEHLRAEGEDTPETRLDWQGTVEPDFTGMSDEEKASIEARIEETRADPEFRAGLKRRLEKDDPGLARLMEVDWEP